METQEILEEIRRNDMQIESLSGRLRGSNVYHFEHNLDARLQEIENELKDDTQTEEAQNKRYKLRVEKDRILDLKRLRELQAKQAELRRQLRGEESIETQNNDEEAENNKNEVIKAKYMEMWQSYKDMIVALETWKQKEYKASGKEVGDAYAYFQEKDNGLVNKLNKMFSRDKQVSFTDVLDYYYEVKKKQASLERRDSKESLESNDKVKKYYKELKQEAEYSRKTWYKTKANLWQLQVKEFCKKYEIDPNTLPEISEVNDWIDKSVVVDKPDEPVQTSNKAPEPDLSGFDIIGGQPIDNEPDEVEKTKKTTTRKSEEKEDDWSAFVSDASKISEDNKAVKRYDEFAQKHPKLAKIRDFFGNLFGGKGGANKRTQKLHPIPTDLPSVKKTAGQLGNEFRSKIKTRTPVGKTDKIETKNEEQHSKEEIR